MEERREPHPAEATEPSSDEGLPTEEDRAAMLGFASLRGVGYWTLRKLYTAKGASFGATLQDAGSTEALRALLVDAGAKLGRAEITMPWPSFRDSLLGEGYACLRDLERLGIRLIFETEPAFPEQLLTALDWPKWIFVEGSVDLLQRQSVALVGTRKASDDGFFLTDAFCSLLHGVNAATVSGLADGIDARVHEVSLRYRIPTIAVLGTGILQNFPKGSGALRGRIVDAGGAVVTEYLPLDSYSKENFVRRNRIQAGLASAVVPLEWREKSGTAHTVRYASETSRPLIGVRMPDWSHERPEMLVAEALGAKIFTLPIESRELREHVLDVLEGRYTAPPPRPKRERAAARKTQTGLF